MGEQQRRRGGNRPRVWRQIWGESSHSHPALLSTASVAHPGRQRRPIVVFVLSGGIASSVASFAWRKQTKRQEDSVLLLGIQEMSALDAGVASADDDIGVVGFAKLVGEEFVFFMQAYEMILGRNTKKRMVDFDLSVIAGGENISHHHARIFYDFEKRDFFLGSPWQKWMHCSGYLYIPGDGPVKLKSQDLIQIGKLKLYFLLPRCIILESLDARRAHIPSQSTSSSVMRPAHVSSPSSSVMRPAHTLSQSPSPSVMRPAHIPTQFPSSSAMRLAHIPTLFPSLSITCPSYPYSSNSRCHSQGNSDNGTRVGTATQGMLMNQSQPSFGELNLYCGPFDVEPIRTFDEHVNNVNIRTDKDTCNQQLQLKEEKDITTYVATLLSNSCAPREWIPVENSIQSKIWPGSKVQKYLTPEDGPSTGTIRKPWYSLLELLKKHPEHFVISTVCRGTATSEFVSLDSLLV